MAVLKQLVVALLHQQPPAALKTLVAGLDCLSERDSRVVGLSERDFGGCCMRVGGICRQALVDWCVLVLGLREDDIAGGGQRVSTQPSTAGQAGVELC